MIYRAWTNQAQLKNIFTFISLHLWQFFFILLCMQILSSTEYLLVGNIKAMAACYFFGGKGSVVFFWDIYGWERSEDRISDLYNWRVEWQIKMGSTKGGGCSACLCVCVCML